jgi:protein phosphatase
VKVYVYSEKGAGKKSCEDAALVDGNIVSDSYYELQVDGDGIIAIADGVGGNAGGEYASRFVLNQLGNIDISNLTTEKLEKEILDINLKLLQYASSMFNMENMATTLTGFVMAPDKDYIFHVGNTRLYIMQGNYLKQVTEDQTTYQWLCKLGQTENAEACNKNEITYCMGGGNEKFASGINVQEREGLKLSKRILMTTDGIHEYLDVDELEEFVLGDISEHKFKALFEKAWLNGSVDDKTVIVMDVLCDIPF